MTRRTRELQSPGPLAWRAWSLITLIGAVLGGCGPARDTSTPPPAAVTQPPGASRVDEPFVEVAAAVGLDFQHVNGMSGEFYFNEMVGGGVALFDYDNDGDLDIYLVQGHLLGPDIAPGDTSVEPGLQGPVTDRLFRNDLDGAGNPDSLGFTDVTAESGFDARGYGMGVAAGDIDNDGWVDLYVSNFGPNQLWRNNGDGTFSDRTVASGADDARWSVSSAFLDYDRDGWLDLYVGNYVNYSMANNVECFHNVRTYCGPDGFVPVPDRLFRNRGDGTFEDATAVSQVGTEYGPALGVATADLDGNGWVDIYVANDLSENRSWMNQGDGTFVNTGLFNGSALNDAGDAEAGMGVDAGDFDGDGDEDLFISHLVTQTNTLYVNDGTGLFEDQSVRTGLGPPSLPFTGFGTAWFDYDNDGWLDVIVVNGAVDLLPSLVQARDPYPLHQTNQLFHNLGNGRFEDVSDRAGAAFESSEVSRGAAFGDIDNDGDMDVVVTNNNGPVRLLLNGTGNQNHWVGLRMVGASTARDMLGTRVAVVTADRAPMWRRVRSDGSYASANDPRVLVGLGATEAVTAIRAVWADGRAEEWSDVTVDAWTTLRQGTGTAVDSSGQGQVSP
ncbi:MAG TPA: CRTAC1 family protein [Acidobacteria bacterium]|nr:CRTAC1 family protein [Acidobacteriota bacterium]